MKIGVDITCFKGTGGGIIKSIQQLVNACKKYYPEIEFISFSNRFDLRNDFNFYNKKYFYISLPFNLHEKYIKSKLSDCDYLLFGNNGDHSTMFPEFKDKNISIIHDVLPLEIPGYFKSEKLKSIYKDKTQSIINVSKIIFTPSEYSKQQIISNFECNIPIIVMPWGLTMPNIKECKKNNSSTESYFLYIGGYDKRKGMIHLLKAFLAAYDIGNFHSKLIFTGRPKYFSKELANLIKEDKRKNILQELGFVNNIKLANLIYNAKGLIYPSKYEGFGLPIIEGMALDCPIITTHGTCIDEIAQDACIYVDIDDTYSFANSIIDIEKNDILRYELIKRGRENINKYSWKNASKIFINNLK